MQIGVGIGIGLSGFISKIKTLFSDNFNRIDASTLGAPWVYFGAVTWGIQSNKAWSNDIGGLATFACYQAPTPNVSVSANITFGTNEGLALRLSDAGNNISVRISGTTLAAFRFVSNASTQIGTYTFSPVAGTIYALKAICNGSSIRIFLNGVEVITIANETFNLTTQYFGLRSTSTNAATAGKFDDFLVEAL